MIVKKSLITLLGVFFLNGQLSAQCGDATSGTACANTGAGDAIISIGTVNTVSIGAWNTQTTTSTGQPRYTFTGVRAGTIIRFASCTGMDAELTLSGPAGFTLIQRDADNELNVGLGCTPNGLDESFYAYCTIAGDYTLRMTMHGSCANMNAATKNLYWNVTNRPMASVANAYGASTWNRYYYDGTDHNYFYGSNLGYSGTLNFTDNWGTSQPNGTANTEGNMCDADNFSTRYWRSQTFSLAGNTSGVYDIRVITDDGVRLSSNGGSSWNLFNLWDCGTHDNTVNVALDGSYNFQMEQRECGGGAQAAVSFTCLTAIGGNLTIPSTTNLITLSGHRGIIEYWESSPDGTTWTNIGNAGSTTITGSPGNFYRVRLKSCASVAYSAVSLVAPDNYWGVYGLNHTGYAFGNIGTLTNNTLQGGYTNGTLDINSPAQWVNTSTPSSAAGYSGNAVTIDNHTVVYRRKGFACREYQIDLDNHDDGVVMYINGTLIYSLDGCCADRGVIWQGILSTTDIVEFRVMEGGGGSNLNVNFIEVDGQTANIGASPNPVCVNGTLNLSSSLTGTAPRYINTVDIAIADNTCYSSYINVTNSLNANQLTSLLLNINHTYTGDLDVTLFAPNGSSIDLTSDNGAGGDNYTNTTFATTGTAITSGTAPFNGTYTPEQAFSVLTGTASGMWRLRICDDAAGDVGTFLDWQLNFPNTPAYIWTGPNSYTASVQNPVLNPVTSLSGGTYNVNITSSGCTSTNSIAVTLNTISTPLVAHTGNTTICAGESTTLGVSGGIAGTGSVIRWYSGANGTGSLLATGASYTVSPGVTTTYYIRREGTCNNTADYTVTVLVSTLSSTGMSAGDYIWTGADNSDWSNELNWKVYNAPGFSAAVSEPTSTTNVFIDQPSGCVLDIPDICCGPAEVNNLTVRAGGFMEISPNMTLEVNGTWTNNSGLITNIDIAFNSDVEFVGFNFPRNIGGNTTTYFGRLENVSTAYLDINTETVVKNRLTMTGGFWLYERLILGISPAQPGTLVCDLNNVGGWLTGPSYFRRYYAASTNTGVTGFFPLGAMPSIYYRPVTLEFIVAPTTGGWIEARFVETTLTFTNGLPIIDDSGADLYSYMDEGYWEINPGGGLTGGYYDLKLRYDGIGIASDPTSMRIIKAPDPHTAWVADGDHGALVATNSITRTWMSGFSWFVIATGASPLPVELTNFSGTCETNGFDLHWSTSSEHNSASFEIERSLNGTIWENIGSVQAAGNSNQELNYSFLDTDRPQGTAYYRLRQIDLDGEEKIYDPISMTCFGEPTDEIIAYPNPNSGTFTVAFESNLEDLDSEIELKDMYGRIINSRNIAVYKGTNQVMFNTIELKPGEYVITVKTDNSIKMVKVIVI